MIHGMWTLLCKYARTSARVVARVCCPCLTRRRRNEAEATPPQQPRLHRHEQGVDRTAYPGRHVMDAFPALRSRNHPALPVPTRRHTGDDAYVPPVQLNRVNMVRSTLPMVVDAAGVTVSRSDHCGFVTNFAIHSNVVGRACIVAFRGDGSRTNRKLGLGQQSRAVFDDPCPPALLHTPWLAVQEGRQLLSICGADFQEPQAQPCCHTRIPVFRGGRQSGPGRNGRFVFVVVLDTGVLRQFLTMECEDEPSRITCRVLSHELECGSDGVVRVLQSAYGLLGAVGATPSSTDGCVVCMSCPASVLAHPCRHVCMCEDCARSCPACPMCRGAIQRLERVSVQKNQLSNRQT